MTQYKFSINLQESAFPLVSAMNGKAVLIPNLDQSPAIPSIYWMENIIPVARGVATPSYIPAISSEVLPFTINQNAPENCEVWTVYSSGGNSTYLLQYGTMLYLYQSQSATWTVLGALGDVDVRISVFYHKGRTLVFHPTIGLNEFDEFLTALVPLTVVGLSLSSIISMTGALSYIIATDGNTIYWSSPINDLNFDPTSTGSDANAGSTQVLAIKGNINFLAKSAKGFIAYATANAAEVVYTGSAENPWRFIPVLNSNGVYLPWHHTAEANGSVHFLWSDTGLASITEAQSQQIFPEVSDFLTGKLYEEYDTSLRTLVEYTVPDAMEVKINFVANRYLCISYGRQISGVLKYILIYDLVLKRWGRLRIDHLAVINLDLPQRTAAPDAEFFDDNILQEAQDFPNTFASAFLPGSADENFRAAKFGIFTVSGALVECDLSNTSDNTSGIVLYGDIALTRNRFSEVIEVELSGINTDVSVRGRSAQENRSWLEWTAFFFAPEISTYQAQLAGRSHELEISGKMMLSSVVITLVPHGTT